MNASMSQVAAVVVIGIVVFGTSVWVLIDANRLGMKSAGNVRQERWNVLEKDPAVWFLLCLLLWIVGYPMYLTARAKFLRERRTQACTSSDSIEPSIATASQSVTVAAVPNREWIGSASLLLGVASIPVGVLFGVLASPLWLTGIVLGIWGTMCPECGRRQAIAGLVTSIVGLFTMITAIILMAMWLLSNAR